MAKRCVNITLTHYIDVSYWSPGHAILLCAYIYAVKRNSRSRLPAEAVEAAEALLELATGSAPERPLRGSTVGYPFAHPDAQRRFCVMSNQEELRRALDYLWEKWTIFLHPAQRQVVERSYRGPARVSGSSGTGKTIVALHRAQRNRNRTGNNTLYRLGQIAAIAEQASSTSL